MKKIFLLSIAFILSFSLNAQNITIHLCKDTTISVSQNTVHDTVYIGTNQKIPMDLYLLGGQSNAVGAESTPSVPDSLRNPIPNSLIFNYTNDSIEQLQYGVNNFGFPSSTAKHGIELAFMYKRYQLTGDTSYMIKYAQSGTYIYKMNGLKDWNVGSYHEWYWTFRQTVNAGLGWLDQSGHYPNKITLIWMQGEQDSDSLVHANAYYQNTLNLFLRLKHDIPALANMQVIIVKTRNINASNSNYDTNVAAAQQQLADDYPSWIQAVSVADIDTSNNIHFTSDGYNRVGIRVAGLIR